MLAMLELDYSFKPTREQYDALRMCAPSLPAWEEGKDSMPYNATYGDHLIDLELARGVLVDIGHPVKFKPFKNNLVLDVDQRLRALERSSMLLKQVFDETQGANKNLIQVHVPNAKLIEFNEVEVVEDQCTHSLQTDLDAGWRIIAVCPPLEQRRPTYIIGRHNPDRNKE